MSRRLGAAGAGVALSAIPGTAVGHAFGETFQLPVPLWLYLAGAATAVAVSLVVSAVVVRVPRAVPDYRSWPVPDLPARVASAALAVLGMALWYGAIAAGVVIGGITPLPAVLFWIGIWVGLPIISVVIGYPWPSLSPFRTTHTILERGVRLIGIQRLDAGLAYPSGLGRWPAVALLGAMVWAELILPGRDQPGAVATILAGYTLLTLAGMVTFGPVAWLRNAELFEVLLGWFGRVGPLGRRTTVAAVCKGCTEGCNPARCVDCPECAVAAEPGERRSELRAWFTGLTEVERGSWSDAAFIVLALAAVSFDGLSETAAWGSVLGAILPPVLAVMGPTLGAYLLVQTIGLVGLFGAFMLAFGIGVWATRRLGDPGRRRPLPTVGGTYASTLLPIAGGYLLAHYLTLLLQGVIWLPTLLTDPTSSVAPDMSWIPISAVWYLSVGAIVLGHVAAVVLAHRIALKEAPPGRAVAAGVPLVALMVGYTVLSLWIIAQPIVLEPGVVPAASLPADGATPVR